jgi:hypothetical protein
MTFDTTKLNTIGNVYVKPQRMPSGDGKQRTLTVRMPNTEYADVQQRAKYDHSMNQYARRAILLFPQLIEVLHSITMLENITPLTQKRINAILFLHAGESVIPVAQTHVSTTNCESPTKVCTENPSQNAVDSNA